VPNNNYGPSGYTVHDLIFWTGFIVGDIAVYFALEPMEWHNALRALAGAPVGLALGWLSDKVYTAATAGPRDGRPGGPNFPDSSSERRS
jgi:hypothetical protein